MSIPNTAQLQTLMTQANIVDERELASRSGVSGWQISRLQQGLVHTLPVTIVVKLAQSLQLSVDDFLAAFLPQSLAPMEFTPLVAANPEPELEPEIKPEPKTIVEEKEPELAPETQVDEAAIANLKAEYQRLEEQLANQSEILQEQWQAEALNILEAWLLQWSAAASAAQKNQDFPAKTLVALTQPLNQLLESWDVHPIGNVGEYVGYEPQLHQLVKGGFNTQPGDLVQVQNAGYQWGDRLLHRAKVIA
ncbi:MAG: helix-turn-helix domain-containing protein [Limnothrix sp. RL_2_0]|nr:helix-turn-helix domain-containing protein [Limnothrix sp. RL_2_0]